MSDLKPATRAFAFFSVLYQEDKIGPSEIINLLGPQYSDPILFTHDFFPMKDYYSKEMGQNLKRCFFFYPELIERTKLVELKKYCDALEKQYLLDSARTFNIDPGLICLDQVLLSSGKPYSHRIYLGEGVFAELTYQFQGKTYQSLSWTYPDYQHQEIISKFNWFRSFLLVL
ncbi:MULTISPECIES: DUF4416 family protein [unclassified Halobacteriovorax]|uniref:DUF4416 family protein n=1 Tax=unclassified Halobacteriovorax TaxID=2639665 RepID=UPI00399C118B